VDGADIHIAIDDVKSNNALMFTNLKHIEKHGTTSPEIVH